jgi:hypothetical protein
MDRRDEPPIMEKKKKWRALGKILVGAFFPYTCAASGRDSGLL